MSRPALIEKLLQAGKWLFKPDLIPVDGTTLKRGAADISVAIDALARSGGGLAVDTKTGKLYVDFSLVPDDQMQAIVLAMVQQGGGLAVDGAGKLYVDFASMPTEKFEAMLKSIRVPIWFSSHKTFYVNIAAGSDTLDEGRGESERKPFKTIRAALSYVTSNYNLNVYNCIIKLDSGDYTTGKRLTLPGYTTTTGRIYIDGPTEEPAGAIIDAPGISAYSTYSIRNITCKMYNYATGASVGLVSASYGAIYLQNVILDCTNYEIPKGMIYPLYANNGGIINIWSTSVGVPNGVKIKVSDPIGEAAYGIGALLYASASSAIAYVADIEVIGDATMKQCTARVTGLGAVSK